MVKFLSVTTIEAEPVTKLEWQTFNKMEITEENEDGYLVEHNGVRSWIPKKLMEKQCIKLYGDNRITQKNVDEFIQDSFVDTEFIGGKPVTKVDVILKNGMILSEATTCVDPYNYNEEVGEEICLERLKNDIWFGLGFMLQGGINNENQ